MDEFDEFLGNMTADQLKHILPSIKAADAAIKRDRGPQELRLKATSNKQI